MNGNIFWNITVNHYRYLHNQIFAESMWFGLKCNIFLKKNAAFVSIAIGGDVSSDYYDKIHHLFYIMTGII